MKPYSKEFRGEVLAACDMGRSTREVSTFFNVSESWLGRVKQERPVLGPDRLVSIDETGAKTNITRPRGRAPRGERLLASVRHGQWKTTSLLAALRTSGLTAPLVINGAINGEIFLGWVRYHLVPTLQSGEVVVMDNLGVQKVVGVREAIAAAGERGICLPPYRPDLNPTELFSSKFKWLVKSASARTVEALWSVCSDVRDRFTEAAAAILKQAQTSVRIHHLRACHVEREDRHITGRRTQRGDY